MSEFVMLTRTYDGKHITINLDRVISLAPVDKGTKIIFSKDEHTEVFQTVDDILNLLRQQREGVIDETED